MTAQTDRQQPGEQDVNNLQFRNWVARGAAYGALVRANATIEEEAIVGTAYIEDKVSTDVDILVLLRPSGFSVEELYLENWTYSGSRAAHTNGKFASFKRVVMGVTVNLLVTDDVLYFMDWVTAAEVCRFLHVMGVPIPAGVRHGIHEIIMDDSTAAHEATSRNY